MERHAKECVTDTNISSHLLVSLVYPLRFFASFALKIARGVEDGLLLFGDVSIS
jgi:hypothetical protein